MSNLTSIPAVTLHDGGRDPPARLRRLPGPARGDPGDGRGGAGRRLPPHRHRRRLPQRGGVGAAIAATGIPREEVFVTTKLWNSEQGYDSTLRAFEKSLERLGLDHVDLYLIHWPLPTEDRYLDTWRAFERIQRARAAPARSASPTSGSRTSSGCASEAELHADRQPDRAAPAAPAGRAARLARRARHRHRGLEPARPGRRCSRTGDGRRSPSITARRRPRWSCAGTCSSATS